LAPDLRAPPLSYAGLPEGHVFFLTRGEGGEEQAGLKLFSHPRIRDPAPQRRTDDTGQHSQPRTQRASPRPAAVRAGSSEAIRLDCQYPCPPLPQVSVTGDEFQAVPGPEARAERAKTMRHISFPGPGGHTVLPPGTGSKPRRGARRGAHQARPILRNYSEASAGNSIPAEVILGAPPLPPGHKFALAWGKDRQSEGGQVPVSH